MSFLYTGCFFTNKKTVDITDYFIPNKKVYIGYNKDLDLLKTVLLKKRGKRVFRYKEIKNRLQDEWGKLSATEKRFLSNDKKKGKGNILFIKDNLKKIMNWLNKHKFVELIKVYSNMKLNSVPSAKKRKSRLKSMKDPIKNPRLINFDPNGYKPIISYLKK